VGSEDCSFIGGMRYSASNATYPLAELTVGAAGLTVALRWRILQRVIGYWLPSLFFPWRDIESIQLIRGALPLPGNTGVRIVRRDPDRRTLVFWCFPKTRDKLGAVLRDRGVNVSPGGIIF
jgi:hypothetical protein